VAGIRREARVWLYKPLSPLIPPLFFFLFLFPLSLKLGFCHGFLELGLEVILGGNLGLLFLSSSS